MRKLFLILAAAGMVALAAGSADAAFPGDNGKIAFVKDNFRQGSSGIFAVAPDGSGVERIGGAEEGHSPSWSADGQKLVFAAYSGESERDFNEDIYVTNADGSGLRRVTNTRAYESSPAFFPDGETIAFTRYTERNGSDVFTMKLDGTGLTRLTDDPGFYEESVAVSPNGQKIAFTRYRRTSDIIVMNADGTDPVNLTGTGRVDEFGADWSPDGQRLAFTSYRFSGFEGLAARAAEEQEGGTFTPEALTPESLAARASGSKESVAEFQEDAEISVINADGTRREDLTTGPALDILPAFSPAGDKIVFSKITFSRRSESSDLILMGSDGSNKESLTETTRAFEYDPDWQPLQPPTPN